MAASATPTPIPAFAPVDRPELGVDAEEEGLGLEEVVEEVAEVGVGNRLRSLSWKTTVNACPHMVTGAGVARIVSLKSSWFVRAITLVDEPEGNVLTQPPSVVDLLLKVAEVVR